MTNALAEPTPATLAPRRPSPPSEAQLDAYAADGYLDWGPLLAPDELAELRQEYDRLVAEAEQAGTFRNLSGDRQPQRMLQIMQLCERSLAFRRLLYDPRILAVVTAIIGPNVLLFHDQALSKPPRSGGAVNWHQDNGYWRCAPANLLSCWLTLDDAVAENGAMQVVPGSHLRPLRHVGAQGTDALLEVPEPDPASVRVIDVPAGGCMFHHCQTLHYTAPNRTARPRRAFAIHYMPPGTRDREGRVLRASWAHPVLSLEL